MGRRIMMETHRIQAELAQEASVQGSGTGRLLSLGQIFGGWAGLLSASIGWSIANPKHATLRLSQRVIHGRIHAQLVTVGALALAAFAEASMGGQTNATHTRNVSIVARARPETR